MPLPYPTMLGGPPVIGMRLLWATPIMHRNLKAVLPADFNAKLAHAASEEFARFRTRLQKTAGAIDAVPPATLNNQFFHLQMQSIKEHGRFPPLEARAEYQELKAGVKEAVEEFLRLHNGVYSEKRVVRVRARTALNKNNISGSGIGDLGRCDIWVGLGET